MSADRVIAYTRDDLTKSVMIYDFTLDSVRKVVNKDSGFGVGKKINDLLFLKDLVEAGKMQPMIYRR